MRLGEAGDQRRRRGEMHRVTGQDRLSPERYRQVGLANAWRASSSTFSPLAIRERICFGSIDGRASKTKPASSLAAKNCASFSAISMRP